MAIRKWLTRSIFLLFVGALVFGGLWLRDWVKPSRIREQLLIQLHDEFPGVDVEVESARLRLLGGISVSDLRFIRKDDPNHAPFLVVPSAVIYHDKEMLNRGQLVVRKVELNKPQIRLERDESGRWNVEGLTRAGGLPGPAPLLVARQAVVAYADRRVGSEPLFVLHDVELMILNDPRSQFAVEAKAGQGPAGPCSFQGRVDRVTGNWWGTLEFAALALDAEFNRILAHFAPEAAEHARSLQGTGSARLDLVCVNGPHPRIAHDLRLELHEGRFQHPQVPLLLEQLDLKARCRDGHVTVEKASARLGQAELTLSLEMLSEAEVAVAADKEMRRREDKSTAAGPRRPTYSATAIPPPLGVHRAPSEEADPLLALEERMARLDVSVKQLALGPNFFKRMPPKIRKIRDLFTPNGSVSVRYELKRSDGACSKRCVFHPEGLSATYQAFPCPMHNIRGTLEQNLCDSQPDELKVDLTAEVAGRPVTIKGQVIGERPDLDVDLHITGDGLPLGDEELIAALPKPYPQLVRRLHPGGRADLDAVVKHNADTRRDHGPTEFDNTFTLSLRDAIIRYEDFPYLLERASGTLVIHTQPPRPTRLPEVKGLPGPPALAAPDVGLIEFTDFQATHNGAVLHIDGRKEPTTGGAVLTMHVRGESVPFDEDLRQALAGIHLDRAWEMFSPRGLMNCTVQARLFERRQRPTSAGEPGFSPMEDLELNLAFAGPAIEPHFFPYLLTDTAGRLAFRRGKVDLTDFRARHGGSVVRVPATEVLFRPTGGYWAELRDLSVAPLVVDAELLRALPNGLRSACEGLELRGPMSVSMRQMVVDEGGPEPPRDLPIAALPSSAAAVRGYPPAVVAASLSSENINRLDPKVSLPPLNGDDGHGGGARLTSLPGLFPSNPALPQQGPNTGGSLAPSPTEPLPVIYWDGKLLLEGASLRTGVLWEDVRGCIGCRGRYEGNHLGRVLGNAELQRAAILRQPLTDIHAHFHIDPQQPDILRIPEIRANLYGGEIGGEARLTVEGPFDFKVKLNATRVRLDALAREQRLGPGVHLEGLATAQLYLQNPPDPRTGVRVLEGGGALDVPNGKLLNLPLILDLLKFIKGKIPDETAFEEAHAEFRIRGERMLFGKLDLMGNAISLGGQGEMNTDGSNMKLEFYTVWSRLNQLLPEALTDLTAGISKQLFKFVVRGKAGGPFEIRKEPVPLVVEPVKRVMERMKQ
jgi:hypothetical protein